MFSGLGQIRVKTFDQVATFQFQVLSISKIISPMAIKAKCALSPNEHIYTEGQYFIHKNRQTSVKPL